MTDQNQAEQNAQQLSPGQMLTAAREALGLSQEAIAEQLYLSRNVINDVENDDYRRSAAMVYSRGYVRSYARIVAADEEAVLASFDALGLAKNKTIRAEPIFNCTENKRPALMLLQRPGVLFGGLFSLLVLLLLLSWLVGHVFHHRVTSVAAQTPVTNGHVTLSLPEEQQATLSLPDEQQAKPQKVAAAKDTKVEHKSLALKPTYTITQTH